MIESLARRIRAGGVVAAMLTSFAAMPDKALAQSEDRLASLGAEVWDWRARTQPSSGDDIPRIERPDGWLPDFSPAAMAARRATLEDFEARWRALRGLPQTAAEDVDYRLIGSALARVRWELDHVAAWQRQPHFYIDQTLAPIFTVLLPPPPVKEPRAREVLRLLEAIPETLGAAKANLTDIRAPFRRVGLQMLARVPDSLQSMAAALAPEIPVELRARLGDAVEASLVAFADFTDFVRAQDNGLAETTAVGRESYLFFLDEVALYPYAPDELLAMAEQEWERAVAFAELESHRNLGVPEMEVAASVEAVVEKLHEGEHAIHRFLESRRLLSVPDWVQHYTARGLPDYLAPIGWLGVNTDQTGPSRLDEDATTYLPEPSPDLGYFNLSRAKDPRPVVVHEGVPGHYLQLALSWAHPNPLRRHFYDSGPNEGIGFYAEEMMLQAGLFDDSPKTREVIYSFSRLRALRVEVDVKLALGAFTIAEAGEYLAETVPMDRETAEEEAIFFAATPGQAISYQIGKLQILDFLAEAKRREGEDFDLQAFHDFVWLNGNVPIALQRQEYFAR